MNKQSTIPPTSKSPNLRAGMLKRFTQVAILFAVQAAILFIAAGQAGWTWAWVYLGISLVSASINAIMLMRAHPEIIAERAQASAMKGWDKIISGLWSLIQFIVLLLVAGLDQRFGWTHELASAWHITGAMLHGIGLGLFGWAMISNAYFSTVVRIQSERGHTVCDTGPYRYIRHPGYAGAVIQSLGIPLLMGSLWALIPGMAAATLMIMRTSFEDGTLQAELPGYREYTRKVRYRLIPGIW
ncbi:MAG: isoprenylcysteine carboxylmethyltransferase family protein [Anaerolineaceae bacterium]|jgi:protein-S-isoprenylcysteine O-methyltransferase Ste14